MKVIEYYFDFLSPYSYLSWQWIKKNKEKLFEKEIEFSFKPVTLSSIIGHFETKGPAQIETKRNYLFKDCLRFSKLKEIPFTTPLELPFNSLYALRSCLVENVGKSQFEIIDLFFRKGWSEGQDIGTPENLIKFLMAEGFPGTEILDKVNTKEMRKALKLNVQEALSKGVFGVPSFVIDDELFWGNDSIPYVESYLEEKDNLDKNKYEAFLKEHPFQ